MIGSGRVRKPLVIVDLRQESHGFLQIQEPLLKECEIAVGWYVERDWINVGKGLASIEADETGRLAGEAIKSSTTVNWIQKKTAEDGIDTAKPILVRPTGFSTERNVAIELGLDYLRLPTTDHVRPRDSEVDEFVRFALGLAPGTWLHFHCRGGDGRTTTFFVRHDIMHNAPEVSVEDILKRQHLLGGSELGKLPPLRTSAIRSLTSGSSSSATSTTMSARPSLVGSAATGLHCIGSMKAGSMGLRIGTTGQFMLRHG